MTTLLKTKILLLRKLRAVEDQVPYSEPELQRSMLVDGIICDATTLSSLIAEWSEAGYVQTSETTGRHWLTTVGEAYLAGLEFAATLQPEAPAPEIQRPAVSVPQADPIIRCSVEYDVNVTELALDGWWASCDSIIKAELFNRFYEEYSEEEDANEPV